MAPINDLASEAMTIQSDVLVTPAMARKWLGVNIENNRNRRDRKIATWARDMAEGRWRLTAETLKFRAGDGALVDGQNRLHALLEAETLPQWETNAADRRDEDGIRFSVAYNVDPDAVYVMDSGSARTFGDALKFRGASERFSNGAVVNWAMMWDHGNRMASGGGAFIPSHAEKIAEYDRQPELFDAAARRGVDIRRAGLGTSSAFGLAYLLFARLDRVAADDFFDTLISGLGLTDENHPIARLRARMIRRKFDRIKPREELAMTIRAWNHYGEDKMIGALVVSRDELTNANFPLPRAPKAYPRRGYTNG